MGEIASNTGEHIPGMAYAPKKPYAEMMQKFDLLPAEVRQAIAECPLRFNVDAALRMCAKGREATWIAAYIRQAGNDALDLAEEARRSLASGTEGGDGE